MCCIAVTGKVGKYHITVRFMFTCGPATVNPRAGTLGLSAGGRWAQVADIVLDILSGFRFHGLRRNLKQSFLRLNKSARWTGAWMLILDDFQNLTEIGK